MMFRENKLAPAASRHWMADSVSRLARLALAAFITAGLCAGQESRGTLVGRVLDSAGAAVAGARVEAVRISSNTGAGSTTNGEGNFEIPYLLPGVYRVTATSPGFKKAVEDGIELRVDDRLDVDFKLEIGDVAESVVVTGETPLLDTATAAEGLTADAKRAAELLNVGGNSYYLAFLAPGITRNGQVATGLQLFDNVFNNFTADGTKNLTGEATLDGVADMSRRATAYVVPQDLVQEVKVQTASYDATSGHAVGVLINMATKSGTNALHGTAYDFDQRIEARDLFSENLPVHRLHQQWGGTLSGPVFIPKIYDGRNHTFFSFGYEGLRINQPVTNTTTVPTAAEKQGDFSALLALGSQYQIYDPATIAAATGGHFSRQPFPGNIVPASRFNPIGAKLAGYYPNPVAPGVSDGENNYVYQENVPKTVRSLTGRVDHQISEKHRVFVRVNDFLFTNSISTLPTIASSDTNERRPAGGILLDDVYVFNPRLLLNLRYGVTLLRDATLPKSSGFDLSSLGFPASLINAIDTQDNPAGIAFPQTATQGLVTLGATGGTTYTTDYQQFGAILTRIAGNHSFRIGGEFRLLREDGYTYGNVAPNLQFSSTYTNGPLDSSAASPIGQGIASMLLGIPTGGSININPSYAEQSTYSEFYVQDDWKVTSKLTLNLGLRYELEGAPTERFNRTVEGFDYAAASPIEAQAQANYAKNPIPGLPASSFVTMGGLTFAGTNGEPRALWTSDKNNFAPEVGLAWQLTPKTVVRSGYGFFYDQIGINQNAVTVNQAGFSQATTLVPTQNNGLTFTGTLSNPFPNGLLSPIGAAGGLATYLGQSISFFDPKPLNPYMQRWSFSLQRELPSRILLDVSYVGNRANKLAVTRQLDAIPAQYLSTSPVRDQTTINSLTQTFPNPFLGISNFAGTSLGTQTITRAALLTRYPQFTGVSSSEPLGHSDYNALQVEAEKRFQKGITFQVAYTRSKFMEADTFRNASDPSPEKVISNLDYPTRITINGFYELPIGRGKSLLSSIPVWLDKAIGGWQVEGLYEVQTGAPLGFGNAIFTGNLQDIPLPVGQRSVQEWFNVNAGFDRNSKDALADNIQTLSTRFAGVRADGINYLEASVSKNWIIKERFRLQFRCEEQNVFNHPMFAAPNTTPTSAAFGAITATANGARYVTFGLKLYF